MNNIKAYGLDVYPLLARLLQMYAKGAKRILDIGCADGEILYCLNKQGLLKQYTEVVGVDKSSDAIAKAKVRLPHARFLIHNIIDLTEFEDGHFDVVICSNTIEHVEDDMVLVAKINRVLRDGGMAYVSSCIKRWYGTYFYRRGRHFYLEPTHIREYSSAQDFLKLFNGVMVLREVKTTQITYPPFGLLMRVIYRVKGKEYNKQAILASSPLLRWLYQFRLPIPGYYYIEGIFQKPFFF